MKKMELRKTQTSQSLDFGERRRKTALYLVTEERSVELRLPLGFQGETVPACIVVMELLWQCYGLDLLHPTVARWLEQNAPDLKSSVTDGGFVTGADRDGRGFKVESNGTLQVFLSLRVDDRLRDISYRYLLDQRLNG
ncbi:MAG TPA: hypothetical protein VJ302_32570 [Blastocatellia bacterium]|nr:hypothetical protein [Blastocatellia bacterium]